MSEWVDALGFEEYLSVSKDGRVLRKERRFPDRTLPEKIAKQTLGKRFLYVKLNRKNLYVHHLVLSTFTGPRPEGLQALHRDDDPFNNHIDNLYWGTPSQNNLDAVKNGRHPQTRKDACPLGHNLSGYNLVPSALKTNRRECLACSRALSYYATRYRRLGEVYTDDMVMARAKAEYERIRNTTTRSSHDSD